MTKGLKISSENKRLLRYKYYKNKNPHAKNNSKHIPQF